MSTLNTDPSIADLIDRDSFAATIVGDAMEPKYPPGTIVIFSGIAIPRSGDDCLVRLTNNDITFRQVDFQHHKGKPHVCLTPLNIKYRGEALPHEQISGTWRATHVYLPVNVRAEPKPAPSKPPRRRTRAKTRV